MQRNLTNRILEILSKTKEGLNFQQIDAALGNTNDASLRSTLSALSGRGILITNKPKRCKCCGRYETKYSMNKEEN